MRVRFVLVLPFLATTLLAQGARPLPPALQSVWLPVHVTLAIISIALAIGVWVVSSRGRTRDHEEVRG